MSCKCSPFVLVYPMARRHIATNISLFFLLRCYIPTLHPRKSSMIYECDFLRRKRGERGCVCLPTTLQPLNPTEQWTYLAKYANIDSYWLVLSFVIYKISSKHCKSSRVQHVMQDFLGENPFCFFSSRPYSLRDGIFLGGKRERKNWRSIEKGGKWENSRKMWLYRTMVEYPRSCSMHMRNFSTPPSFFLEREKITCQEEN